MTTRRFTLRLELLIDGKVTRVEQAMSTPNPTRSELCKEFEVLVDDNFAPAHMWPEGAPKPQSDN